MRMRGGILAGIVFSVATFLASPTADARNLYFDMWCQEQGYGAQRCDARSPADVEAFEAYWRAVEKYEEPYFYDRQEDARFRDEMNSQDEALRPGIAHYEPEMAARPN